MPKEVELDTELEDLETDVATKKSQKATAHTTCESLDQEVRVREEKIRLLRSLKEKMPELFNEEEEPE